MCGRVINIFHCRLAQLLQFPPPHRKWEAYLFLSSVTLTGSRRTTDWKIGLSSFILLLHSLFVASCAAYTCTIPLLTVLDSKTHRGYCCVRSTCWTTEANQIEPTTIVNLSMCTSFPLAMHTKNRKEEWKGERGEYAENMVLTGENSSLAKRVFRFRECPYASQLSSCPTSHCTDCLLPFTYERGWYRGTLHIIAKEWRTMSGKCSAIIRIMSAPFRSPTMPPP